MAVSLKEILSPYGIAEKDLDKECSNDIISRIALKIIDWKVTGHCLGVPKEKISAIDVDNKTEEQRRIALLDTWRMREGKNATYSKLIHALHDQGQCDLVEILCNLVKSVIRTPDGGLQPSNGLRGYSI